MPHYQLGVCFHCGREDDGRETWALIDSVVFGAGFRSLRQTATVDTQLDDVMVCGPCLDSPWGLALRDLLAAPMNAAARVDGCQIHCTKAGPGRVRFFTEEHGRCPVCYGRAEAIRTSVTPRPPLARRAARAVARAAGAVAIAFAGDLGDIYREMKIHPERSTPDDHPSGPLPILVQPPDRDRSAGPAGLGARVRAALGPNSDPPGDDPGRDVGVVRHDARPAGRPHLPRSLRLGRRGPGPAGRTHALPDRPGPGTGSGLAAQPGPGQGAGKADG